MPPDFIIIGAMKCGTSTLYEQLAAQPGVFMCTPKEPNFFSDDRIYANGLDWYRGLFAPAPAGALCGEASTHYTKLPTHPATLERLVDAGAPAKFIFVMRHPLDRLVSHYIHDWTQRRISSPIDDAVRERPELIDYGRYAYQIEPWLDRFGPDRVLPVFLERMNAAPQAEFERIARFLALNDGVQWRADFEPANVSSERLRALPLHRLLISNPAATKLRRALVPTALRDRVKSRLRMQERPELGRQARAEATAAFDADLRRLGDWLGAPLNCGSFKETVLAHSLDWRRAARSGVASPAHAEHGADEAEDRREGAP